MPNPYTPLPLQPKKEKGLVTQQVFPQKILVLNGNYGKSWKGKTDHWRRC